MKKSPHRWCLISAVVRHLIAAHFNVINVDKLTYAGNLYLAIP